ncbi:MAG: AraC family transcriptional regulator [Steroidobacteraceae bacterium]|nr:AraC family transcriptional regulator [Steroidobacteraceae bacterium]
MKPGRNPAAPPDAAVPAPTLAMSFAELQGLALASDAAGRLPLLSAGGSDPAVSARLAQLTPMACAGLSELLNLSDDLLLIRSDFHADATGHGRAAPWQLDTRGWLYLHFRLDGLTCDQTPDGRRHTLGGGSFFLATSSQPQSLVREVLSDLWRVVTIAFRPSFADRDLRAPDAALPTELRRFQSGDAESDFFYASQLTSDMSSAVRSLLAPAIRTQVRPIYLRAKVVELVCLAIEQLQVPAPATEAPLKLSHRDTRALEEARRVLDACTEPVSLDQLARRVGLNRRKLALGFKMLFGATVGEYHRDVRLETAFRMLGAAQASVGYAAAVAGYSDVGSFGKAFRARYGCLPSDVRPSAAARRLGSPRK